MALTASLAKIISIHLANLGRGVKSIANSGPCSGAMIGMATKTQICFIHLLILVNEIEVLLMVDSTIDF